MKNEYVDAALAALAALVVSCLLGASMPAAVAQVIADPAAPRHQQPTILNSANGTPQIDIQTPSAAGVSRNAYSRFDVTPQGVILNNSRSGAQTQLGGYIPGNPWLAKGPARVILNEVNSSDPSRLRGYVEVAGTRAQVVIANPAGISCDGCGFLNAHRATLTTGVPLVGGGGLDGYRVQRGTVDIGGAGLDASYTDYAEIIARAVQANAGIWANRLKVAAGAAEVDHELRQTVPTAGIGAAPTYAIDVADLGGMYAGQIALIGSESGVGVRNAGRIGASAGDVVITADGRLENSGTIDSAAQARLVGTGLDNRGVVRAQGEVHLSARQRIEHRGTLLAGDALTLDGASLTGGGALLSRGAMNVSVAGDYDHAGAFEAAGDAALQVGGKLTNRAALRAGGTLAVSAAEMENDGAGEIGGTVTRVAVAGTLTNRGLIDGHDAQIDAAAVGNVDGGRLYGDRLSLKAEALTNDAATIGAREHLDVGARRIRNGSHALIFSAGSMALGGTLDDARQAVRRSEFIDNRNAHIDALGDLAVGAGVLHNVDETLGIGSARIGEPQAITEYEYANQGGRRYAAGEVRIRNAEVDHLLTVDRPHPVPDDPGVLNNDAYTRYDYTRTVTETVLTDADPAKITAGGTMSLTADYVRNDRSWIIAGGAIQEAIGKLENTEIAGSRVETDVGTATRFWRIRRSGTDAQGRQAAAYEPAPTVSEVKLKPSVYKPFGAPLGSGVAIGERRPGGRIDVVTDVVITDGHAPVVTVVRTGGVDVAIPSNGLFRAAPAPTARYRIEIDPRFVDGSGRLSSDWLLERLRLDPERMQKRLGDGFYEQRLVREQVAQLTGRRFLEGYADDEAQYRALLERGAAFAEQWHLRPGVALTAEQMEQLTGDVVWLVEQTVRLPDGRSEQALVPQLYVRVKDGDVDGSGALISADATTVNASGEVRNLGTIIGRRTLAIEAENVDNLGGRLSGAVAAVHARTDLHNVGGTIDAVDQLAVSAGRDLTTATTTRSNANAQGRVTNVGRVGGLYLSGTGGGTLIVAAGRDVELTGARVDNASSNGQTIVAAGRDLKLNTIEMSRRQSTVWDGENRRDDGVRQEIGSVLSSSNGLRLSAGNDVDARGASITAEHGGVIVTAGRDARFRASEAVRERDEAHRYEGSNGWLSNTTTVTRDTFRETVAQGTTLSGDTVYVQAGRDIGVTGSSLVSTAGTALVAGHDVDVEAATHSTTSRQFRSDTKTGLFGNGGLGFTAGMQRQTSDGSETRTDAAASTIGSTAGNVAIIAGNRYNQIGSDVIALQGDVGIFAKKVEGDAALEAWRAARETRFEQTGLTVSVTAPALAALQTTGQMTRAAGRTSDARLQALAGAASALATKNAADAVKADPKTGGGVNLSVMAGRSTQHETVTQNGAYAARPRVIAGGNVKISASGDGKDSTVTMHGAQIKAAGDVTLHADGKVDLLAARNVSTRQSSSGGASGGVGVAIGLNSKGASFGATAQGSVMRGSGDGSDETWSNTQVSAGNVFRVESGGDATLRGAVVNARQVTGKVGGNLHLESLQDVSRARSTEQSVGGSVTLGHGFAASAHAGQQQLAGDYASVVEQSGIRAGDGGFQIEVKGNTHLQGAVLTSTDLAVRENRNRLDTGTLTYADIQNHADYRGSGVAVGGGYTGQAAAPAGGVGTNQRGQAVTGGQVPGTALPTDGGWGATLPVVMSASGSASSVTASGISAGAIRIANEAAQKALTGETAQQAIAGLDRSVSTDRDDTHALAPIFDEREIRTGFEIVGQFANQTGTFLDNRAKEADAARRAAADPSLTPEQREAARQQAEQLKRWAPGGDARRMLTTLTAAAGGNVTGGMTAFAQGAAASYLQALGAAQVKTLADSLGAGSAGAESVRAALHAAVGCAGAAVGGQGCGAGAFGAAASSGLGSLLGSADGLSAQQRQARENLLASVTAGAAMMGGGDPMAANSARIEAENNQFALTPSQTSVLPPTPGMPKPPFQVPGSERASPKRGDGVIYDPVAQLEAMAGIHVTPNSGPRVIEQLFTPIPNAIASIRDMVLTSVRGDGGAANTGKITIDSKIGRQLEARGWTSQEVQSIVNQKPIGTTLDNRSAAKTPDGLPRNDSASVYGSKSGYVVVNDRTGEVVQVSGKNDPGWIPDSRIKWK